MYHCNSGSIYYGDKIEFLILFWQSGIRRANFIKSIVLCGYKEANGVEIAQRKIWSV